MANRRAILALSVIAIALAGCAGGTNPSALPFPSAAADVIVNRGYVERLLYTFRTGSDGGTPAGTLVGDASGALYGTTSFGGGGPCYGGCGTVFKLTPSGSGYAESVIYAFQGPGSGDGFGPANGVAIDAAGKIFGTAEYGGGGNGGGIVFELAPSGSAYRESVLYRFAGGLDGYAPIATVTLATDGTLFGSTLLGGAHGCSSNGCGTIYALKKSGSGYTERVLHRFTGGSDGATPGSPPVVGGGGVLYGTAATGGGNPSCGGAPINGGCGVIYALHTGHNASFKTLYAFSGSPNDAANAFAGLAIAPNGNFYGIGQYGGATNSGAAFVFLRGAGSERVIHSFNGGADGSYPLSGLALGADGRVFGTTQYGGATRNAGIAFELVPQARGAFGERILRRFDSAPRGLYPNSGLLLGGGGALYGVTMIGGSQPGGAGTVFVLQP